MKAKKDRNLIYLLLLIPAAFILKKWMFKYHAENYNKKLSPGSSGDSSSASSSTGTEENWKKAIVNVSKGSLNIRSDSGTDAQILGTIPNGTIIGYIEVSYPGWVKVIYQSGKKGDIVGYCSKKYLKLTDEIYRL